MALRALAPERLLRALIQKARSDNEAWNATRGPEVLSVTVEGKLLVWLLCSREVTTAPCRCFTAFFCTDQLHPPARGKRASLDE